MPEQVGRHADEARPGNRILWRCWTVGVGPGRQIPSGPEREVAPLKSESVRQAQSDGELMLAA